MDGRLLSLPARRNRFGDDSVGKTRNGFGRIFVCRRHSLKRSARSFGRTETSGIGYPVRKDEKHTIPLCIRADGKRQNGSIFARRRSRTRSKQRRHLPRPRNRAYAASDTRSARPFRKHRRSPPFRSHTKQKVFRVETHPPKRSARRRRSAERSVRSGAGFGTHHHR